MMPTFLEKINVSIFKLVFGLSTLFSASNSYGQILVDYTSQNTATRAEGILAFTETEYEYDGNPVVDFEIERDILGLGLTTSISQKVNFIGQLGFILDSEHQNSCDGDGFILGGGANLLLKNKQKYSLAAYGFFNYIKEEFKCPLNSKVEATVKDLHLGPVVTVKLNRDISFYGALDLAISSRGDWKVNGSNFEQEFERDSLMTLKLGAKGNFDGLSGRLELTFIGEDNITFGIGSAI